MCRRRNCYGDSEYGEHLLFPFAPDLRKCPRSVVTEAALDWVAHFLRWQNYGLFPYPGEAAQQPLYVFEAFDAVQLALQRAQEAEQMEMKDNGRLQTRDPSDGRE